MLPLLAALAVGGAAVPAALAQPTVGGRLGASYALAWADSSDLSGPPSDAGPSASRRRPVLLVALSSGVGLVAGTLAGGAIGAAADREEYAVAGAVLGGWAGGAVGAGTGAWMANGQRGSLPLAIAVSAVAQAAYVYLIVANVEETYGYWHNVIVAGYPLVAITASTVVTRLTSRR